MFAPPLFAAFIRQFERAVADTKAEYQMSLQVTGLADTVRKAKAAIDNAGFAATRLNDSAQRVVNTIGQVDGMTRQLDAANADLTAAVAAMSNGGPPLEDTTSSDLSSQNTSANPGETIRSSIVKVENANAVAFPAGPAEPIAPTVAVTASTIAAAAAASNA